MVKDLSWKHVAIILGFFGSVVVLSLTGQETATFILVGMGVLGALGLAVAQTSSAKEQTTAVKEQSNGNTTLMLNMIERQSRLLAASTPMLPASSLQASADPVAEVSASAH